MDFADYNESLKMMKNGKGEELENFVNSFYVGLGYLPVTRAIVLCGFGTGEDLIKQDCMRARAALVREHGPLLILTKTFQMKDGCGNQICEWLQECSAPEELALELSRKVRKVLITITTAWSEGKDASDEILNSGDDSFKLF